MPDAAIITNLVIEASDGSAYSTERYERPSEVEESDDRLERAPGGRKWFRVGDGERKPEPVTLRFKVRPTSLRSAIDEVQEAKRVLKNAVVVRWGEYHRPVDGYLRLVAQPAEGGGYNLEARMAPTGPAWLDEFGQEVSL